MIRLPAVLMTLAVAFLIPLGAPAQEGDTASTASAPVAEDNRYRIGSGDLLKIEVFGVEEFDRTIRVLDDGTVTLPLLGNFSIDGRTLAEAESQVASMLQLEELVNDPQVTIFVEEYVSRPVYVEGAVAEPGVYQLTGEQTVLDMLAQAGGLLETDNQRAARIIYILRSQPDGTKVKLEIDADALIYEADFSQNRAVRPNDVIVVPPEKRYKVYVAGAVEAPGPVEYLSDDGITVLQAVTAAGGPTERANLGKVFINRRLDDGTTERIKVELKKIIKGKMPDVMLQNGDTIVVPEWFF